MYKNFPACYFLIIPLFFYLSGNFEMHASKLSNKEGGPVPVLVSITDSIHISHYEIHIDTLDYAAKSIKAHTRVTAVARQNNTDTIYLSLLQLTIDSVILSNGNTPFLYNDTTISIFLPTPVNQNDSIDIMVYYHGNPKQDATGWGGFYFSGTYAFNLGVGFAADPHCFGRVWFPCLDEFTERASYDFFVNTPQAYKAFCNGQLISETSNPNGTITWHWKLIETIPTYLASIAVAPFYTLERNYQGLPIVWACLPADTVKTLSTFSNIDTVLFAFQNAYGPYPFNKVGYVEIPFNSGAMEHATSIHIGKAFIDGTKTYETLWAHELSHMWWGDKVTCETAGDMWLNEGFASFNEAFITQVIYGNEAYKDWLRTNHRKVLQFAHTPAQDGNYYSLINIPQTITYGYHVYQKGADMVHTLRYYMGDSLFFDACKYHLNALAYGSSNSYQLRDNITISSGVNMNRFFDDWIFTPGFPHFSIDSVTEYIGAFNHYFIHTRQRTKGNTHLYAMPVDINLTDGINDTTVSVLIDSLANTFQVALLWTPLWISLDRNEKISDAISDFERKITTTGTVTMPETFVSLNVLNAASNKTVIRIEHNWVTPDPFKGWNQGIRLSDYHYWKVDGIFDPGFHTKATFTYNGGVSSSNGYVDNSLLVTGSTEDSLVILYRPDIAHDWQKVNGFTVNKGGSAVDKTGSITVDTMQKGEYVFGIYDHTVTSVNEQEIISPYKLTVSPNPAQNRCHIVFELHTYQEAYLQIIDTAGKLVLNKRITNDQSFFNWNTSGNNAGTYLVRLVHENMVLNSTKLVLMK